MIPKAYLFFLSILAGFALYHGPGVTFLSSLTTFFQIVGGLAILVFSFALLYMGVKALFK